MIRSLRVVTVNASWILHPLFVLKQLQISSLRPYVAVQISFDLSMITKDIHLN